MQKKPFIELFHFVETDKSINKCIEKEIEIMKSSDTVTSIYIIDIKNIFFHENYQCMKIEVVYWSKSRLLRLSNWEYYSP